MEELFETWINTLSSVNTKKKYSKSVELYCEMVFSKKPTELTKEDLVDLKFSDTVNKFVKPLQDSGVKDSTIKSHLTAMRSFVKTMRRERVFEGVPFAELTKDVLTVETLKNRDTDHTEAISLKDLDNLESWIANLYDGRDKHDEGQRYVSLVDFMFRTAVRLEATFNVKWDNFTEISSPYGGDWAVLKVIDKGTKLNEKYLPLEYFENLKYVLYNGDDNEKVFNCLSANVLRNLMRDYSEEHGRNLTPHSLKAGAATTLYSETHDLLMVRDFCDHESVATTEKYIHRQKDPHESGTAILTMNYDRHAIDGLSKEELLMLIHSRPELESAINLLLKKLG